MVAWQLAGAWELAELSQRVATARTLTLHGALPIDEIAQTALPWMFGAPYPTRFAPLSNFGYEMKMEIASYVPPAVFLLTALAIVGRVAPRAACFWIAASIFFFVLALGPQTPVGKTLFFAPGFRLFNIPGRNLLTFHFGLSVLCGLGTVAMLRRGTALAGRRWVWFWGLLPTLVAAAFYPVVVRKAALAGVALPAFSQNVAVTLPIGIALASTIALIGAWRAPARVRFFLAMATVVGGSAYFGWNSPWFIASGPARAMLDETRVVAELKQLARPDEERVLAADGWLGPLGIGPNQSILFGLRSVSGYGPLLTRDYAELTGLTNAGWIRPLAFDPGNVALDILATRWVFPSATPPGEKTFEKAGIRWNASSFGKVMGGTCGGPAPVDRSMGFELPRPGKVLMVAIVTSMGCALELPQGTIVAHAVLEGGDSRGPLRVPIRAGIETAEWSAACPSGSSQSRHSAARIFDSTPLPAVAPGCEGHHYLAQLPASGWDADRMRIEWDLPQNQFPKTTMRLQHVTVIGPDAQSMQPLLQADTTFADTGRWRRHRLASGNDVFENLRARPLAWLVGSAIAMPTNDAATSAVRSGLLPDGTRFDPARSALTVDAVALPPLAAGQAPALGAARVLHWQSGDVAIETRADTPALLVLSQRFYPGWQASVDDRVAPIRRVDGGLQGIEVPAGAHRVTLEFAPRRLPWLLLVAAIALLGVAALLVFGSRAGKRPPLVHGN